MVECSVKWESLQSLVRPHAHHSVRMTYRPSAALWLLGSLEYPITNSCGPVNESLSFLLLIGLIKTSD